MKKIALLLFILFPAIIYAQVGIGTTTPNAQLEIKSSSETTPANTDGLLIPKVNNFPAINPTVAQQGMLVYLNNISGADQPGFYYWDNTSTTWVPMKGNNGVTLDQAYDFGGAGNGKTITADTGAVLINGTDGLVSTGTVSSGAVVPSGGGTRMVWNPRKSAFRAGTVLNGTITPWDDAFVGIYSVAFGFQTQASGSGSVAFGSGSEATGDYSAAFGSGSQAMGSHSTTFGNGVMAIGNFSTAFGQSNTAFGSHATAFGHHNNARSYGEVALGIGATDYTPSTNGTIQFRAANATDRLLTVGNAIDLNNNGSVDPGERSDAMIVLKNGLTRLPSTTNAMITAADGKAVVTKEYLQSNSNGTLDQAYDFGGAGLGKTITADAGAVLINGTDGLVSTGTINSGAIVSSGAGTRMVWNPRKAAFRAGNVQANAWDDANIGLYSTAFGSNNRSNGSASTAFGFSNTASGQGATAFGVESTASGNYSTTFGFLNTVSGSSSTVFGSFSTVSGDNAISFGTSNLASGTNSTTVGQGNVSRSFAEAVFGIGATNYTATTNGETQFRTANATDRLFVVGNAVDADNDNTVDLVERSDAIIILKNGLTRLPSTTNAMITAADGKAVITKEYLQSNTSGTLDQAYDFGGAGLGKTITADAGAVTINGTDGLVATGVLNSGAVMPSGNGPKMIWNPRKSAFRVGSGFTDDTNTGIHSISIGNGAVASGSETTAIGHFCVASGQSSMAIGLSAIASGTQSIAIGNDATASGINSMTFGINTISSGYVSSSFGFLTTASGSYSTAFGSESVAAALYSTAFGRNTTASGSYSTAFGLSTTASGSASTAFGSNANASGINSIAFGAGSDATGTSSTAFGTDNTAASFGETVFGIGATNYTTSANGPTQFRAANATDRLLVVGNATDSNSNNMLDNAERHDALVILKNGKTGIGTSTPQRLLHLDSNGTSIAEGQLYLNQSGSGDALMHFGISSARHFNLGIDATDGAFKIGTDISPAAISSGTLMTIMPTGLIGMGTATPNTQLEIAGGNKVSSSITEGNLHVRSTTNFAVNRGGSITLGGMTNATADVSFASLEGRKANGTSGDTAGYLAFKTNNGTFFAEKLRITEDGDVGIGTPNPGGQLELTLNEGRKPISNTWTIPSDARLKTVNGSYEKGLAEIIQLQPIKYNYKNTDKKTFDEQVLGQQAYGFLAQQVQPIFPEAVGTDADGYLNFDLHPILIASVNAFKELNQKNERLNLENETLRIQLKSQSETINNILKRLEILESKSDK